MRLCIRGCVVPTLPSRPGARRAKLKRIVLYACFLFFCMDNFVCKINVFLPHKEIFSRKFVSSAPFSYISFVSGHKGTNKRAKKTNLFVFSRAKVPSFSRLRLGEGLARRPIGKAKAAEPSARPQTWLKGTVERRGMQINHLNLPIFLICGEGLPGEHFPR